MKALIVRVYKGSVSTEGEVITSIGKGLVLFLGIDKDDSDSAVVAMADKIANLRLFENEKGKMDYSVKNKNYEVLCIPNFTLCANTSGGRRPSFEGAMSQNEAKKFFENFVLVLKSKDIDVKCGIFGAHMDIDLRIDGPVNITLESRSGKPRN